MGIVAPESTFDFTSGCSSLPSKNTTLYEYHFLNGEPAAHFFSGIIALPFLSINFAKSLSLCHEFP